MTGLVVIGIDPGDVHVGYARWDGVRVVAGELAAGRAVSAVHKELDALRHPPLQTVLVVERFSLYTDRAMAQSGSQMETAQMIGALRYVAWLTDTAVVLQGADIKKPTRKQLKARGIKQQASGSTHASDAELHLMHYLLKEGLWKTS